MIWEAKVLRIIGIAKGEVAFFVLNTKKNENMHVCIFFVVTLLLVYESN